MEFFQPPKLDENVLRVVETFLPAGLKMALNIDRIEVLPKDKALLRSLRNDRLLFFTNHPTAAEPPVTFHLANIVGDRFYYMAARQLFDHGGGMMGRLLQAGGGYSVIAGTGDRDSLKMTRKLLAQDKGKLVIFPEGEPVGGENDALLPFQPGLAQLAFWGLQDARKRNPAADCTILPAFIKYTIPLAPGILRGNLSYRIGRLEKRLGISGERDDLLGRFMHTSRILLEIEEQHYRIKLEKPHDFDYRIGHLRHVILDNVARRLNVDHYPKDQDAIHKLRFLFSLIELIVLNHPDPRVPNIDKATFDWAQKEVEKAYNFIVIKPDYLSTYPSAERFYEWLLMFDYRVFGRPSRPVQLQPSYMPRVANVRLAKPFKLSEFDEAYKKDKRKAVTDVTARIKKDMQVLLDESLSLSDPIV